MSENPIRITGTPNPTQSFSSNGVALESLKDNKLLFDFFKSKGYKEDAIIFSTDIEKLTQEADSNDNSKLSIKEARAMGLEGNRREIRSALKQLREIKNTELAATVDNTYSVQTGDGETSNYTKDGTLRGEISQLEDNSTEETFYINGDKAKIDKNVKTSADKQTTEETTYLNGDKNTPYKTTIRKGNDVTTTSYDWFNGNLNSKTTTHGNDVETTIYKQVMGKAVPQRVVEYFNSDPNSCKSTEFHYNDNNKVSGQTIEYTGAKIKDNVITEEIRLNPETGEPLTNEKTLVDGSKQYFQNIDGKMQQVEKLPEEQPSEKESVPTATQPQNEPPKAQVNTPKPSGTVAPSQKHQTKTQPTKHNPPTHTTTKKSSVTSAKKKSTPTTIPKAKAKPQPQTQQANANNAQVKHTQQTTPSAKPKKLKHVSYSYRVPGNQSEAPARTANGADDARVLVRRSRLHKTANIKALTYNNIRNTMCYYNNEHNCTLPSALLRQYSRTDKNIYGTSYTYSDKDIIADLRYVKHEIELAKSIGVNIPDSLYAYVPPYKNATPERIRKEVRMYEAVFGKGSAHYQVS